MDLWQRRWPKVQSCVPHELKVAYRHRWVRFHCLPESKRYPETEQEYGIVLDRYNTVLDEIFDGPIHLMTVAYTGTPRWVGAGKPWQSVVCDDEPGFETYAHQFVTAKTWERGILDDLCGGSPTTRRRGDRHRPGSVLAVPSIRRRHGCHRPAHPRPGSVAGSPPRLAFPTPTGLLNHDTINRTHRRTTLPIGRAQERRSDTPRHWWPGRS